MWRMETNMTDEQVKKIGGLKKEIIDLQNRIYDKEMEIERIVVNAGGNYEGCYVEYFDGDEEYIFMKVERQNTRNGGRSINIQGPAIRLPDTPLREDEDDDEGLDTGFYDEADGITFSPAVLNGTCTETIRKITKEEMAIVLDYYINTMKENLL